MRFVATCKIGLEALVADELRKLSIEVESVNDARIVFCGGYDAMARACLWLRTAERVLLIVSEFQAVTFEQLYEGVRCIRWRDYINRSAFVHVNGKSAKSKLFSVSDCQSITKKAIVDSLCEAYRMTSLPENGEEIIIEIGLLRDIASVCIDCCGAGLSRRGYRTWNVAAPISETLGAAIVMLSRYNSDICLVDPMCGSGTMPIEAAMIACNMAVGLNRSFAAEKWGFIDGVRIFDAARDEARSSRKDIKPDIIGSDIDARAIDICRSHAKKVGVNVKWIVRPIEEYNEPRESGIIVCNPPYGERLMDKRNAEKLYHSMRERFAPLTHWDVNIITSHPRFEQIYGQRADKRRKLSNGGLTCTLYRYFAKNGFTGNRS